MPVESMLPGQNYGQARSFLAGFPNQDIGYGRPYLNDKGVPVYSVDSGRMKMVKNAAGGEDLVPERVEVPLSNLMERGIPVQNAAIMRKDQWIQVDQTVYMAARSRLNAWSDLVGRVSYGNFNAMNKMILEWAVADEAGEAVVDMDGITDARNDRAPVTYAALPLPIIHDDFSFSARELGVANSGGGTRMDVARAEQAGRRVAEMIEKMTIGIEDGFNYGNITTGQWAHVGNSQVYGYLNHPGRFTKIDMTVPTGANPEATVADVIAMRETLIANRFYGPYQLYYSTDWDSYLDRDYAMTNATGWGVAPNQTLRMRLTQIQGIQNAKRLDMLTPTANNSHAFTMILVDMNSDNVQAINGMDITTLQYETKGGLQINFKVMAIAVPLLRRRYDTTLGVVHGRTA